jgi:hypothetical protein
MLLESAKSSLIFDLVEGESNVTDVVHQSILSTFQDRPVDFYRKLLDVVADVSVEQMVAAGKKHMGALFRPKRSSCAIVCHPAKLQEIVKEFRTQCVLVNYPTEVIT